MGEGVVTVAALGVAVTVEVGTADTEGGHAESTAVVAVPRPELLILAGLGSRGVMMGVEVRTVAGDSGYLSAGVYVSDYHYFFLFVSTLRMCIL